MDNILEKLFGTQLKPVHSLWFKRFLYVYVLVSCIYWLFQADVLFGQNSFVYKSENSGQGLTKLALLLYKNQLPAIPMLCLAVLATFISLLGWRTVLADVLMWIIIVNVHFSIYTGLNSGDYLLNVLLLYNIFLRGRQDAQAGSWRDLRRFLHNSAVVACMGHFCLLYLTAGLTKLSDESWQQGLALLQTTEIRHFRVNNSSFFQDNNWLAILLNYFIMFYQTAFPLMVWIRPVKKMFLIAGILMHLYISFFMGLVGFGLIMLSGYVFFWPLRQSQARDLKRNE